MGGPPMPRQIFTRSQDENRADPVSSTLFPPAQSLRPVLPQWRSPPRTSRSPPLHQNHLVAPAGMWYVYPAVPSPLVGAIGDGRNPLKTRNAWLRDRFVATAVAAITCLCSTGARASVLIHWALDESAGNIAHDTALS